MKSITIKFNESKLDALNKLFGQSAASLYAFIGGSVVAGTANAQLSELIDLSIEENE